MERKIMFRIITVSLLVVLLLSGCSPTAKQYNKEPIKFFHLKSFSQKELSEIVISSLVNLGWSIDDSLEGKISASLYRQSLSAKVTITYDQDKFVILNQSYSTRDIETRFGQYKKEQIKTVPYNWIVNIKKAIEKEEKKRLGMSRITK
jgi:hypothetical protein